MREVNYWIIYSAISSLEAAEASLGELGIDPDDTSSVQRALQQHVVPKVEKWSVGWRDKLRLSLAYYIIMRPEILDTGVLANLQDFSMPEPSDVAHFFRILWGVLYPQDKIEAVYLDDVIERNDIMELNQIRLGSN